MNNSTTFAGFTRCPNCGGSLSTSPFPQSTGGEKPCTCGVPDYNPNGTANPIGDAAYWRARAERAEATVALQMDAMQARIAELTEQANSAYEPYRAQIATLTSQVDALTARIAELETKIAENNVESAKHSLAQYNRIAELEAAQRCDTGSLAVGTERGE